VGDRLTAVVCDDHPLFLRGVLACLASDPDVEVVATAVNGQACIAKLEIYSPDILVADLQMPVINGFEVLSWARTNRPRLRVLILSMHTELAYVRKAQALGAAGFIAKDDAETDLLAAVRSKVGAFYTSGSIGRSQPAPMPFTDTGFREALRTVSGAELRVLVLLADNLTSRQIAERLHLSVRTVQAHRVRLSEKLGARGPHKLLELALLHRAEILRA